MKMGVLALCVLVSAIFVKESYSVTWSSGLVADAVLRACAGETVSFPWNVSMTTGETVIGVQWFYEGRSQEQIAMLVHGSFLPLASFSGRVELTTNEGLALHHVTVLDSGNYSVEFTVQNGNGDVVTLRRTAVLDISDGLLTRDRLLQVRMSPEARFDNSSKQWAIVLSCGTFLSQPPFDVTWILPSGYEQPSSGYENGNFLLILTLPITGGAYTCRVPVHPFLTCPSGHPEEGRVVVDRTEARLTLLESQQRAQMEENLKLKEQNELLEHELMGSSVGKVSFHARLFTTVHLPTWTKLVMTEVVSNHGNAYSNVTGEFVAPYNGTYFFIASTAVYGTNHVANFFLMVNDQEMDYAYTNSGGGHSEGGTVHAVVTLTRGQKVWLRSYQDSYYGDGPTAFSGFLIYHNFD